MSEQGFSITEKQWREKCADLADARVDCEAYREKSDALQAKLTEARLISDHHKEAAAEFEAKLIEAQGEVDYWRKCDKNLQEFRAALEKHRKPNCGHDVGLYIGEADGSYSCAECGWIEAESREAALTKERDEARRKHEAVVDHSAGLVDRIEAAEAREEAAREALSLYVPCRYCRLVGYGQCDECKRAMAILRPSVPPPATKCPTCKSTERHPEPCYCSNGFHAPPATEGQERP